MDDVSSPPTEIDPYATLELPTTATAAEIKTAYRKLALRHHPDKAPPSEKETAHETFQKIAFAYAILSDERRRKRYDATGNTSESFDLDDEDFDWSDFFKAQWNDAVTETSITIFKSTYQGSAEEQRDVLAAYKLTKGNMNRLFEEVMLSNPIDDEGRFTKWIDAAIEKGQVEGYGKYINESESSKKKRRQKAEREAREAEEHLADINEQRRKRSKKGGASDHGGSSNGNGMGDLATLIQQRWQSRATNFLDDLEAKYGGGGGGGRGAKGKSKKNKKATAADEPSEEAFEAMRQRGSKKRKS